MCGRCGHSFEPLGDLRALRAEEITSPPNARPFPFPFPSKRPPLALQTRSSTPPPLSSDRSRFFCSNARARSRARAEVDDGMAGEQEAALGTPPGPSPGWPSTRSADVDTPPPAAARTPSGTSQPTTSPGRHFAERSARGAQERPLLHLRTVRTVPVVETTQEHVSPTYVPNVTLHLRTYVRTHVTFPYVRTYVTYAYVRTYTYVYIVSTSACRHITYRTCVRLLIGPS